MSPKFELADTDPKVMKAWIEALRALSPGKKIQMVFGMIDFMHQTALRQIRKQHPEHSEREVLHELAVRRYGREVADRVFPKVMTA